MSLPREYVRPPTWNLVTCRRPGDDGYPANRLAPLMAAARHDGRFWVGASRLDNWSWPWVAHGGSGEASALFQGMPNYPYRCDFPEVGQSSNGWVGGVALVDWLETDAGLAVLRGRTGEALYTVSARGALVGASPSSDILIVNRLVADGATLYMTCSQIDEEDHLALGVWKRPAGGPWEKVASARVRDIGVFDPGRTTDYRTVLCGFSGLQIVDGVPHVATWSGVYRVTTAGFARVLAAGSDGVGNMEALHGLRRYRGTLVSQAVEVSNNNVTSWRGHWRGVDGTNHTNGATSFFYGDNGVALDGALYSLNIRGVVVQGEWIGAEQQGLTVVEPYRTGRPVNEVREAVRFPLGIWWRGLFRYRGFVWGYGSQYPLIGDTWAQTDPWRSLQQWWFAFDGRNFATFPDSRFMVLNVWPQEDESLLALAVNVPLGTFGGYLGWVTPGQTVYTYPDPPTGPQVYTNSVPPDGYDPGLDGPGRYITGHRGLPTFYVLRYSPRIELVSAQVEWADGSSMDGDGAKPDLRRARVQWADGSSADGGGNKPSLVRAQTEWAWEPTVDLETEDVAILTYPAEGQAAGGVVRRLCVLTSAPFSEWTSMRAFVKTDPPEGFDHDDYRIGPGLYDQLVPVGPMVPLEKTGTTFVVAVVKPHALSNETKPFVAMVNVDAEGD